MNSKAIGIIIAFTALTVVLNLIKIPVPFLLTFSYMLGDIALVVVFLLYGPKTGVATAFLSTIITIIAFPGPGGIFGPPYYILGVSTMLLGVYIAGKIVEKKSGLRLGAKTVILFVALAVLTRTLIMLPFDYTVFGSLVSVALGLPLATSYALVIAAMPGIVLYNITVPLYVIPTSYILAKKLSKSLKIPNSLWLHATDAIPYAQK
ncbi:MAG: hypothetical protein ACM3UN_00785 [Bacillota bacterium]